MSYRQRIPCPDPKCEDGYILVYNAYNEDPLKGEKQPCDLCLGKGYVIISGFEGKDK